MKDDLKIKVATTIDDMKIINDIRIASWRETYKNIVPNQYFDTMKYDGWDEDIMESIHNDRLEANILLKHGKSIGYVICGSSTDDTLPNYGEIVYLYLQPNFIGKGYGHILFNYSLKRLIERGFEKCFLWVFKDNIKARNFYEKSGFKFDGYICNVKILNEFLTGYRYTIKFSDIDE